MNGALDDIFGLYSGQQLGDTALEVESLSVKTVNYRGRFPGFGV